MAGVEVRLLRWERTGIGSAYLQVIVVGTLYGIDYTGCTTAIRRIRTVACKNKHYQTTVKLKAVVAYTGLEGDQSRMYGEEESYPPFFLRQESHALDRFCIVDMVVTIKGFWRAAAGASTYRPGMHTHSICSRRDDKSLVVISRMDYLRRDNTWRELPGPLNIGDEVGGNGRKICPDTDFGFRRKVFGPGPTCTSSLKICSDGYYDIKKIAKKILQGCTWHNSDLVVCTRGVGNWIYRNKIIFFLSYCDKITYVRSMNARVCAMNSSPSPHGGTELIGDDGQCLLSVQHFRECAPVLVR
jgi:hypothetical protein